LVGFSLGDGFLWWGWFGRELPFDVERLQPQPANRNPKQITTPRLFITARILLPEGVAGRPLALNLLLKTLLTGPATVMADLDVMGAAERQPLAMIFAPGAQDCRHRLSVYGDKAPGHFALHAPTLSPIRPTRHYKQG
jgi:hypothetical protein